MRRPHAALSRQAGPGRAPAIRLPASLLAGIVIALLLTAPGAPCRAADDAGRQGALLVTPRNGAGDRGSVSSSGTEDVSSAARQRLLDVDRLEKERGARARAGKGALRLRALEEAAGTLAFQQGMRWRYARLASACRRRSGVLDRVFNFGALLLEGRVLPPVIRWAGRGLSLNGDGSASMVDAAYRIVRPARLVTAPPVWQAYLLADFEAFDASPAMLPESEAERKVWKAAVEKGWDEGVAHADEVFELNLARLVADFRGMLRFGMLARAGMVSVPMLAEGRLGVRVGETTLDVNATVFRITVPARFLGEDSWKPGVTGRPR